MNRSIIYTDGQGVKITDSTFYVHRQQYSIEGIKDIKLLKMPSAKAPGIILFIIGFALMLLGSVDTFGNTAYTTTNNVVTIDGNMVAIVAGLIFVIAAILVSVLVKNKYAIEIITDDGEKRPLESENKEYVAHVVNALKRSYYKYIRRKERRKTSSK
ncbi:MAG: DUF6232 family protein [Candidatus Cyclobacteriaceae bacterium M2_1C_046]